MNIAVSVQGLYKKYKIYDKPIDRLKESLSLSRKIYHTEFPALYDVTFEVYRGEFFGIVGRNGAGKSTLLKILAGLITSSKGKVQTIGSVSLLQLGVGFNRELSGLENVKFAAKLLGYEGARLEQVINEVIEFADIGDFISHPVKIYSSGMYSRLSFAVGVAVDPDILIADEVLSVGDIRFASKCMRKMHEIKEKGKTAILVTHDTNKVAIFCDRALWLKDGRIAAIGKAKTVSEKYRDYMLMGTVPDKESKNASIKPYPLEEDKATQKSSDTPDHDIDWIDMRSFASIQKGDIRITHVAIYDDRHHRKSTIFSRGDKMLIYLKLSTVSELKDIVVGWILTDKQGLVALHYSSDFCESNIESIKQGREITCCFELNLPPLRNSEYVFSVGIRQYDDVIFKVNDVASIQIANRDTDSGQGGYVILEDAKFYLV